MNKHVLDIRDDNFYEIISQSDVVLVDFWAPWCGPCLRLAPIIKQLADIYQGKAVISKLNIDINVAMHAQYSVKTVPTMIVFHKTLEVERMLGFLPINEIQKVIDKYLS